MNKFIKEHGQMLLWFIFLVFMIISLSMVFTHGIRYAIVVFVFSFLLLCPPIIKFIQRKTRLKKIVLGVVATTVMVLTMLGTNHFSQAKKEEQLKNFQERKEEREKRIEELAEEQKDNEEQQKTQNATQAAKTNETSTKNTTQRKNIVVRASKKSKQYYVPTHPSYNKITANNLVVFSSEEAAIKAGYKKAI